MKPLEFLAAVLPPPGHGHYCVAGFTATRKQHVFVEELAEAKPAIREWLLSKRDIYFALATYADPSKGRKADNAQHIKALFIDMDGYESKKAAGKAMFEFLAKTGLDSFGAPHIVASGGGIHCYWPLSRVEDIATWKPVAESFKRLCKQEGLSIDMTVTADAARVLRIPGTLNHKKEYGTPREVKVLQTGDAKVDLRRFGATVRGMLREEFAPVTNNFQISGLNLAGARPTKANSARSATAAALAGNATSRFETIWLKTERGNGCAQLDYYMSHAQADGMEPLWRGLLSLAKVCEDADTYTSKLSALHPYTPQRTQEKLNSIKGPYSCAKLDGENPGLCGGCPHWGRITNPLALGREIAVDNSPRQIHVPLVNGGEDEHTKSHPSDVPEEMDEDDAPSVSPTRSFARPLPPKGFDYGRGGGVYRSVEIEDSTGQKSKIQVPILTYDLYVVDVLRMEDKELHAHLVAVRPVGAEDDEGKRETEYITIIVPQKAAVSKDELLKVLASYGVLAAHGKVNDPYLYDYVRGAIDQATQARKAVNVPIQFGWQKDGSFVYNNRVFRPDGSTTAVPMPGLENINRVTNNKGSMSEWRRFWELLIARKMNTMLALCLDAFGSTLMHFSEYEGFVWHIGSTESGTGKSLTLTAKASVWGHPIRYRTGKGTSHVAMQQRAGLLNSLPLLIDEITSKARNDAEWVPEFIFNISEGQGKERMESGTNRERLNNSTWALSCTMTSNTHMHDVLSSSRRHSSNGEVMRMLEWTPTKQLKFNDTERDAIRAMRQNYGVAGEAWIRYVVPNYAEVQRLWDATHAKVRDALKFTDEERYWHAACTSVVTAAIICGSKRAGILDVPVTAVLEALGELVRAARENQRKSVRTAEDVLSNYIREHYGRLVTVRRDELGKAKADLGLDLTTKNSTRGAVMGRVEIGVRNGTKEFYIEEQLLRQHCAAMSFGYADFRREMEALVLTRFATGEPYAVKFEVRKNLTAGTDAPEMRVNTMRLTTPVNAYAEEDDASGVALG
jgi:hypothetical protein